MFKIKPLEKSQLKDFVDLITNAYPGLLIDTQAKKEETLKQITQTYESDKTVHYFGAFLENEMVGCMKFFDFEMNLFSNILKVGGLGSVAVHLIHKKEKVAKEMVKFFINYYNNKNCSLSLLYPFRSDFYKKMGYGHGSCKRRYSIRTENISSFTDKKNIKFINEDNIELLGKYYNKKAKEINGLLIKNIKCFSDSLKTSNYLTVGYMKNGELHGYLTFYFCKINKNNPFINELVVTEMLYDNPKILHSFLAFLNSQSDQVKRIVFEIADENFQYLFENPSMDLEDFITPLNHIYAYEGFSVMYRINNIQLLFYELKKYNFANENLNLKLTVTDSFIESNNKSFFIRFNDGNPIIHENFFNFDVELKIAISELSSLITCSVDLKTLYQYGKIELSDMNYLNRLNNLFLTSNKPICLTYF